MLGHTYAQSEKRLTQLTTSTINKNIFILTHIMQEI